MVFCVDYASIKQNQEGAGGIKGIHIKGTLYVKHTWRDGGRGPQCVYCSRVHGPPTARPFSPPPTQEGLVPVLVHEAAGRERAGGSECARAQVGLAVPTGPSDRELDLLFPGRSEFCLICGD